MQYRINLIIIGREWPLQIYLNTVRERSEDHTEYSRFIFDNKMVLLLDRNGLYWTKQVVRYSKLLIIGCKGKIYIIFWKTPIKPQRLASNFAIAKKIATFLK